METHPNALTETADGAIKLVDRIDSENVGIMVDAVNLHLMQSPHGPEVVRMLGPRIWHFHVKDLSWQGSEDDVDRHTTEDGRVYWYRLLGHGDVDHRPLIRTLREVGYSGHISGECHARGFDELFIAEHELGAMRRLLNEARG